MLVIRFVHVDIDATLPMNISEHTTDFIYFMLNLICLFSYDRKCPYQEPRLYCSVVPSKVSSISLLGAELLGKDLAKNLIKKNALDIMSQARNEILDSK